MNQMRPAAVSKVVKPTPIKRSLLAAACCLLLTGAPIGHAADPGLVELERSRLQREQRLDEIRLRLDQQRRAQQLEQYENQQSTRPESASGQLRFEPPAGQLKFEPSTQTVQRRMELEQAQAQERLSQQQLHQMQLLRESRLRHRLMTEPGAVERGELDFERRRAMREREAQRRQFGAYTR